MLLNGVREEPFGKCLTFWFSGQNKNEGGKVVSVQETYETYGVVIGQRGRMLVSAFSPSVKRKAQRFSAKNSEALTQIINNKIKKKSVIIIFN